MKKMLFPILILIVLAVGLAAPAKAVSADGAEQVYATAYGVSLCFVPEGNPVHPDCNFVEPVILPNGRAQITGMVDVTAFTSSDPRWNATCIFSADPFIIKDGPFPLMGSFVCTPTDPTLEGWWEGSLTQIYQARKYYIHRFTAKGYGAFDGLISISRTGMSAHPIEEIEILELPGYEP